MREHGLIRLYKRLATPILALVMLLGAGWGARPLAAATVDTLYHNGKIYTLTESMREAKDPRKANTVEVVATRDGKIIFAGPLPRRGIRVSSPTRPALWTCTAKPCCPALSTGTGTSRFRAAMISFRSI